MPSPRRRTGRPNTLISSVFLLGELRRFRLTATNAAAKLALGLEPILQVAAVSTAAFAEPIVGALAYGSFVGLDRGSSLRTVQSGHVIRVRSLSSFLCHQKTPFIEANEQRPRRADNGKSVGRNGRVSCRSCAA